MLFDLKMLKICIGFELSLLLTQTSNILVLRWLDLYWPLNIKENRSYGNKVSDLLKDKKNYDLLNHY